MRSRRQILVRRVPRIDDLGVQIVAFRDKDKKKGDLGTSNDLGYDVRIPLPFTCRAKCVSMFSLFS